MKKLHILFLVLFAQTALCNEYFHNINSKQDLLEILHKEITPLNEICTKYPSKLHYKLDKEKTINHRSFHDNQYNEAKTNIEKKLGNDLLNILIETCIDKPEIILTYVHFMKTYEMKFNQAKLLETASTTFIESDDLPIEFIESLLKSTDQLFRVCILRTKLTAQKTYNILFQHYDKNNPEKINRSNDLIRLFDKHIKNTQI